MTEDRSILGPRLCPLCKQTDSHAPGCAYAQTGLEASDVIAGANAKGARVTLDHLHGLIKHRTFQHQAFLTICILVLKNGFIITGQSACADPSNYDVEKGDHFALEDALGKLWQLEGYLLKQRLCDAETTRESRQNVRHALEAARNYIANNDLGGIANVALYERLTFALSSLTNLEATWFANSLH